ncbi:hypothetical protein M3210_04340 [Oceanobacillus luteolus]|uniref:Uncharacterized protein n=1 Tax=Oceanobacillus luteolus TaxID=1274358 RepID=A0ABW4HMM4_9BACI|nr:hypothetical protein [Oceanobacillus luteolus]MCM3739493.1 hypothetical protein [Oceanobacillus luteolus]
MQKLLLAQLGVIGVIWIGMAFFFSDMTDTSKRIFYIVTSWLLFIIVMVVKNFIRQKRNDKAE